MWTIATYVSLQLRITLSLDLFPCPDPDCYKSADELIESRGFQLERHWPITSDGYILGVFRLRNPFANSNHNGYPVLMTSSFVSGINQWLWNTGGHARPLDNPQTLFGNEALLEQNLGFELANFGYDVWLFNKRGSDYSQNHTHLSISDPRFWEFSFNEIAFHDTTTVVKLIQEATGHKQMAYVGYSDGCSILYTLLARRPKYNEVFRPAILMAPAARYTDLRLVQANVPGAIESLRAIPTGIIGKIQPFNFLVAFCTPPLTHLCALTLEFAVGFDYQQLNQSRLRVYSSMLGAGTSTWYIDHHLQQAKAGRPVLFDYGKTGNRQKYGHDEPPLLDLSRITSKYLAFIYSGANDMQSKLADVRWTRTQLSVKLFLYHQVAWPDWNHLDYIIANDLGKLITPIVIKTIARALNE